MRIRKLKKEDIEDYLSCQIRIWETLREYLPDEFITRNLNWLKREGARDAWVNAINDPNWVILVAEEGNKIAGLSQGRVDWSRLSHLGFLGVDQNYRRKGIARSLVGKFMEESKNRGAVKISLETSPTLKPAVKLYADLGFFPEGFLRRHRLGVDMIIYSKFLDEDNKAI